MASNQDVVDALLEQYPQFATVDNDRLLALAGAARAQIRFLSRLPDTTDAENPLSERTLALMYKTGLLLSSSLATSSSGATAGTLSKRTVGPRTEEYSESSSSSSTTKTTGPKDFEALFKALVKPYTVGRHIGVLGRR